jgi:hypothetical protein
MNGRFNLLLAAVGGGPNEGLLHFYLDKQGNWTIQDDIAIDPGFPEGIIKFNDFTFSTGPRILPLSKQTQLQYPAGVDRAGSISSKGFVEGYLGDDNFDGYLDGVFNAIGTFPFDSILLPGAPFAQTRSFRSKIPVDKFQALYLTLSNLNSYLNLTDKIELGKGEEFTRLVEIIRKRMPIILEHTKRAEPLFDKSDKSWQTFQSQVAEMNRMVLSDISVTEIEKLTSFLDQQLRFFKKLI